MKFLEYTSLASINDFLSDLNLGERTIKGCLEAYSCKHTGKDKKLSYSLEPQIQDYLGSSSDVQRRKTLVYLVLALNYVFPDHDFRMVNAYQFMTEESWDSFKHIIEESMDAASKEWVELNEEGCFFGNLYKALNEVVHLSECDIFSFKPNHDADPSLEDRAIWSFTFFFYNHKRKCVVNFHISCLSNFMTEGYHSDGISDEYGDTVDYMDM